MDFSALYLDLKELIIKTLKFRVFNSIEPGLTAWKCRLAWLYTGWKG
jgi:hypothetical protein